jgi:hypothetical protein
MRYSLVGGPCDGTQSVDFTVKPFVGFQVLCQTHEYNFGADGRFHDAGVAAILQGAGAVDTRQIGKAWHRLMNVYAVEAPAALRKARAARAFIRRTVR